MNTLATIFTRMDIPMLLLAALFMAGALFFIVVLVSMAHTSFKNWRIVRATRLAEKRKLKNLIIKDDGIENLNDAAKSFAVLIVLCAIMAGVAHIIC